MLVIPMADPARPETTQADVDRARTALWREDWASQALGMVLREVSAGRARVEMTVRRDMLNGFGLCHGGILTTLGDTAMAFASNSHNERAVATNLAMEFLAPGREGDVLVAEAREISRTRRTGLYDATITNPAGQVIALLRGRVQRVPGSPVAEG